MKTLLFQRICSSFASGRSTVERMLRREVLDDEEQAKLIEEALSALTPDEAGYLRTIAAELSRPEACDPKLAAVRYFLTEHRTEGKTWLEHGCIVFSQYYDTVSSLGAGLAKDPGQNYLYIRLFLSGCRCVAILGNSPLLPANRALLQPLRNTLGVDEIILTRVLSCCLENRWGSMRAPGRAGCSATTILRPLGATK